MVFVLVYIRYYLKWPIYKMYKWFRLNLGKYSENIIFVSTFDMRNYFGVAMSFLDTLGSRYRYYRIKVDSFIRTFKARISESVWIVNQYGWWIMSGGPGNGTSTDSTIPITDTEFNSLILTFKVQISESVRIM
jgi:hypothetical protein